VTPGPRAFDIKPIEYDLTPFAGLLNDGRPHRIDVSVVGVPQGQTGWSTPVNVLVQQDAGSRQVTGALTGNRASDLTKSSVHTPSSTEHRLDTKGGHRLTVSGYLDTSHGRVTTTVRRTLANTSVHRWTEGENTDALTATWTDDESVTVDGRGPAEARRIHRTYTMDGTSLRPLLRDPATPWDKPVLMTFGVTDTQDHFTGLFDYAVRSNQYRYIQYHAGGRELYVEGTDPNEFTNVVADPSHAGVIAQLAAYIPT